jgi:hypothetical protein
MIEVELIQGEVLDTHGPVHAAWQRQHLSPVVRRSSEHLCRGPITVMLFAQNVKTGVLRRADQFFFHNIPFDNNK